MLDDTSLKDGSLTLRTLKSARSPPNTLLSGAKASAASATTSNTFVKPCLIVDITGGGCGIKSGNRMAGVEGLVEPGGV